MLARRFSRRRGQRSGLFGAGGLVAASPDYSRLSVRHAPGAKHLSWITWNRFANLCVTVRPVPGLRAHTDLDQVIGAVSGAVAELYFRPLFCQIRTSPEIVARVRVRHGGGNGVGGDGPDVSVLSLHSGA